MIENVYVLTHHTGQGDTIGFLIKLPEDSNEVKIKSRHKQVSAEMKTGVCVCVCVCVCVDRQRESVCVNVREH